MKFENRRIFCLGAAILLSIVAMDGAAVTKIVFGALTLGDLAEPAQIIYTDIKI